MPKEQTITMATTHPAKKRFILAVEEHFHGERFKEGHEDGEMTVDESCECLELNEEMMPDRLCRLMKLEEGSTYAQGVHLLRESMRSGTA